MTRPAFTSSVTALDGLLRQAPRRYRMPPLPPSLADAMAAGSESTLAWTIEAGRLAEMGGQAPDTAWGAAFTEALAAWIRRAMDAGSGDPVFQAQALQARNPQVQAWVRLAATQAADERSVRASVDAFAHPGKLRGLPEGPVRSELEVLHARAGAGDWRALAARARDAARLHPGLQKLVASAALMRLQQAKELREAPAVRQYRDLRARRVPDVGSAAALDQGRASAREGEWSERAAASALERVAAFMSEHGTSVHRVVRSLLTPSHLMRDGAQRAKEEWDAAIVRQVGEGAEALVLLAEAKAAPAAATSDLPRLLRGLAQLSSADEQAVHAFRTADGELRLRGDSLRLLRPRDAALPPQVIYLCTAPAETRVSLLAAAARARLMSEAASLQFAASLEEGAHPSADILLPVWQALRHEPRLRQVLEQYDSARRAREAMLHPDDLMAAVDGASGQAQRRDAGEPPSSQ